MRNVLQPDLEEKVQNQDAAIPMSKCPHCFGDLYAHSVNMICNDCLDRFSVDVENLDNVSSVVKVPIDKLTFQYNDIHNIGGSTYTFSIDGSILAYLKKAMKRHNFKSMEETVEVLLATICELDLIIDKSPGSYFGFLDGKERKSSNLKDGKLYTRVRKRYLDDKISRDQSDSFLEEMSAKIRLADLQDHYYSIDPDCVEWDFDDLKSKDS